MNIEKIFGLKFLYSKKEKHNARNTKYSSLISYSNVIPIESDYENIIIGKTYKCFHYYTDELATLHAKIIKINENHGEYEEEKIEIEYCSDNKFEEDMDGSMSFDNLFFKYESYQKYCSTYDRTEILFHNAIIFEDDNERKVDSFAVEFKVKNKLRYAIEIEDNDNYDVDWYIESEVITPVSFECVDVSET